MTERSAVSGTAIIPWRKHYIGPRPRKSIRTICEVLREIEQRTAGDAVTVQLIGEAFDMAKRMSRALEEHRLMASAALARHGQSQHHTPK